MRKAFREMTDEEFYEEHGTFDRRDNGYEDDLDPYAESDFNGYEDEDEDYDDFEDSFDIDDDNCSTFNLKKLNKKLEAQVDDYEAENNQLKLKVIGLNRQLKESNSQIESLNALILELQQAAQSTVASSEQKITATPAVEIVAEPEATAEPATAKTIQTVKPIPASTASTASTVTATVIIKSAAVKSVSSIKVKATASKNLNSLDEVIKADLTLDEKVMELSARGLSVRNIADELGLNKSKVHRIQKHYRMTA